jgi:hypothetical protein
VAEAPGQRAGADLVLVAAAAVTATVTTAMAAATVAAAWTAAAVTTAWTAAAVDAAPAAAATTAAPAVPAGAAAPAQPVAESIAAPVEAWPPPATRVPTVVSAAEDVLHRLERGRIACPVDAGEELRRRVGAGDGGRGSEGQARRGEAQEEVSHRVSFNRTPASRRIRTHAERGARGVVFSKPLRCEKVRRLENAMNRG